MIIKIMKFKVDGHVRTSKHRNVFGKCYAPNWSEEIFVIKEIGNTVGIMLSIILMVRKLLENSMKKNCKR